MGFQDSILEHLGEAVILTDPNFIINGWNRAAEDTYGWTTEEALGNSVDELLLTEFIEEPRDSFLETFYRRGNWRGIIYGVHSEHLPGKF